MYTAKTRSSNKKKAVLITALAACLVLAVGGGVLAWFSAQDSVTNTLVQGNGIKEPETKPDPSDPEQGGGGNVGPADGYIIEDKWVDSSSIMPDSIVPKNPNVGIDNDSTAAYVFVEVENNLGAGSYFILNKNWKPVSGKCTEYLAGGQGAYESGLFVYIGTNPAGDAASAGDIGAMKLLEPAANATKDVYTGEVFSKVYTTHNFQLSEAKTMNVKSFLAGASNDEEDLTSWETKTEIYNKAIQWMTSNNSDPI